MPLNAGQQAIADHLTGGFLSSADPGYTLLGEGGTGKTYCIMDVVKGWQKAGHTVLLTAPTNKAVDVLMTKAQDAGTTVSTCTLARALGLAMLPNEENKRAVQVRKSIVPHHSIVVVDEASMVSKYTLPRLLEELAIENTQVVMMGDPMQLPPPKETNSPALELFPGAELKDNERFARGSGMADLVRPLRTAIENNTTFSFRSRNHEHVEAAKPAAFVDRVVQAMTQGDSLDDVRAMAWTNARVNQINASVRQALYGKKAAPFEVGERVITGAPVIENEEPLLNTDEECIVKGMEEGRVFDDETGKEYRTQAVLVQPLRGRTRTVVTHVIHPDDAMTLAEDLSAIAARARRSGDRSVWRAYHALKDKFADLRYCYCVTVHRSQGSTYKTALVDVNNILRNPRRTERNRLLYVAFSRASERLVVGKEQFVS